MSSMVSGNDSGSNPFLGSVHRDVLDAVIPSSSDAISALLAELKRRGAAAVSASQWPDAMALYTKAVECCRRKMMPNDDPQQPQNEQQLAIVLTNLSLCQYNMHMYNEAMMSSQEALDVNSNYIKAYYRHAQAATKLHQYTTAQSTLQTALSSIEPNNKVLQKELEKVKELLVQQQQQQQVVHSPPDVENKIPIQKTTTTPTTTTTKASSSSSSIPSSTDTTITTHDISGENAITNDNNNDFTKSDHVRGYKIVNGKKTSYFHNELSEEAKQLIGDITPQKLDTAAIDTTSTTTTTESATSTTSAWNKAGTWEEKDCSVWAQTTLKSQLVENATFTVPVPSLSTTNVRVLKVDDITYTTFHASVASVRGKKRYIYEIEDLIIHWSMMIQSTTASDGTTPTTNSTIAAKGTMRFPEIDSTTSTTTSTTASNELIYDVVDFVITENNITNTDDMTITPSLLQQYCYKDGLRRSIQEQILLWIQLFQATY